MGKRIVIVLLLVSILCGGLALPVGAVDLQLSAPSAVLMDLATGTVLYETNSHERLAPASVTKVMTLLLIMEAVDSGKISWQDMVTASEAAAAKGGSQVYLKVGETMSVEEMVKSITVSSANDCACAMAEFIAGSEAGFVEKMNARAQELGMEDTHFVNCTGLDDEPSAAEHLTSAYDIALMSRELLLHHPDIKRFTTIWMDTVRNGAFGLANTNKLVRFYEGTTGLKTGYTSSAGHCLSASAQREGLELVAVVLHCSSSPDRFQSAKALLDYGFAHYESAAAALPGDAPQTLPVEHGTAATVPLNYESPGHCLMPKGEGGSLEAVVELPVSLSAPVAAGEQVGRIKILHQGTEMCSYPITAAQNVDALSFRYCLHLLAQSLLLRN